MSPEGSASATNREILRSFRSWGYLQADLDWLGRLEPERVAELDDYDQSSQAVEQARRFYCGSLAVEFAHIADPARRQWVQEAFETDPEPAEPDWILDLLTRSTLFEETLQKRYIGNKRFSIEGIEALIPLLNSILDEAGEHGAERALLAMAHRGRLNVMAHVVGVELAQLLAGFEDVDPESILGAGDVKYHLGATGTLETRSGSQVEIHLVSNPSHLEAVNPVALGRARAKQTRLGDTDGTRVLPVLLHGDAAFAGQGVTAETLNLAEIDGFRVGGTIHVIVNNLIGFTTEPHALHSTRFSSDVAKRLPIPIFHVNGEDPEAVVRAARLAARFRYAFSSDVVVDLIGYRRHGHSEVDDPTITQPGLYRRIKERPPLWKSYGKTLADQTETSQETFETRVKAIQAEFLDAKEAAEKLKKLPVLRELPEYWKPFSGGLHRKKFEVNTGLPAQLLGELADRLTKPPPDFEVHPKVRKLLEQRAAMGRGEKPIDFGMAEALALASILENGQPIRISGQDTRRGTFSHRHSVLIDSETGAEFCPLAELTPDGPSFEIFDSVLSEAAVLGYEYGYSRDYPEALVVWEAQFGDFANGAQIIFDQFVTAGEDKWGLLSGLVVLLPHGFEGQGPEHSSARIERFLQLAAEDAIQVAQPTTAGQYFHLLRRQALRSWRKPLVVFTPKSMLRNPRAASLLPALERDGFWNVMPDRHFQGIDQAKATQRVLLCSGKIGHELRAERERRGDSETAVVLLEQLYPFPADELGAELDRFAGARELVWVQEEPANMGALFFVVPQIERLARGRHVRTIKRSASASPATGSGKAHHLEQKAILNLAFG